MIEQNMKIVMLIDTLGYGGGAERQFAGLAVSLHRRGCQVKVVAYHDRDGHQKELREAGVSYTILPECKGRFGKLKAVRKQLAVERPDVVISYKDGPNSIACMLKAMGAKWKLIVSDRNTLQSISRSVRIQYKLLYRFADAIVPT
ncbi:MAG: glycosyltransferase, partial [Duncaniella sp.]|nr:glycosyltransferase [Duncaniella sp.]